MELSFQTERCNADTINKVAQNKGAIKQLDSIVWNNNIVPRTKRHLIYFFDEY